MTALTALTALTVPDVLRRAERVVAERGHCKGDYSDAEGRVCGAGAISAAISLSGNPDASDLFGHRDDLFRSALDVLLDVVGAESYDVVGPIAAVADWNDDENRTEAEVRAALLAAAQRAEAGT